ncbi:hypothetical protein SODG_004823 [Sodalis praecaptivus]
MDAIAPPAERPTSRTAPLCLGWGLHERLPGTALAGMVNILLVLLIIDGRQAYWPEEEGNCPDLTTPDGDRNG